MDAPLSTALLKNRAVAQPAAGTCTVRSSSGLATVRSRRSDTMCSTSASGTATVGISASGSRNSGAVDGDFDNPEQQEANAPGDDQIEDAEHVEAHRPGTAG